MSKIQEKEIESYSCKPRSARRCLSPLGSKWMIKAKLSIGPNGEQIAEPGDQVDLDAYVQASRASTDMATIIARYKAGDETVLNVSEGFYGDVTVIPSSVNDYEKINKLGDIAAEKFAQLPDEIKEVFGDANSFLNAVMANKVDELIASYQKPEVKEGEAQ